MSTKFLEVEYGDIKSQIKKLKDEQNYSILLDVTATDYLKHPDKEDSFRFEIIYILRTSDFKSTMSVKS